jgi:hypothetical protein
MPVVAPSDKISATATSPIGSYRRSSYSGIIAGMGVEKMSVSFDLQLGAAIREAAADDEESVSAWLAEAARSRLRKLAIQHAMADFQAEFGEFTDDERAEARELIERAERHGQREVA